MRTDFDKFVGASGAGNPAAAEEFFTALYQELHRLAKLQLRRGGAELSLGTTTLLHEAYLNLSERSGLTFPDRPRFLAYAARAMRGLIIDYVRRKNASKRGAGFVITLAPEAGSSAEVSARELEELGEALEILARLNPELAELVDLHFFGGFTLPEIAGLRQGSLRTVERDWRTARLMLHQILDEKR